MRFQFSLATLLVFMTVLAVVCAVCVQQPVREEKVIETSIFPKAFLRVTSRRPTAQEIASRLALWEPLSMAATLGTLWSIRHLKSRRHTEPQSS